jgi:hypothetical protein
MTKKLHWRTLLGWGSVGDARGREPQIMDLEGQDQEQTAYDALSQDTLQVMLLLGKLGEKVNSGADPPAINALFAELLDRVGGHFSREEQLMEQKSYSGRHWHRVVHRELVYELRLAAARGNDQVPAVDKALLRKIRSVFSAEGDDEDVFRARAKLGLFKQVLPEIHPADLAEALPDFDLGQRSEIFGDLTTGQASGTLEEVGPQLQRELIASLSIERVAELIDFMTPAQAASVLRNLTPAESEAILRQLGPVRSRKIVALVETRQNQSLLPFATLRYLRAPPQTSIGKFLEDYRNLAVGARVWRYVYVVAADGGLLGVADIKDMLIADPAVILAGVMMTNMVCLKISDHSDAASLPPAWAVCRDFQ